MQRKLVTDEMVRQGHLSHLLHADQRLVKAQMAATQSQLFVLEIARRWGKTWLMAADAIETCLRFPGCRVPYGSSTDKSLREFIIPTFAALIEDFPADCRPTFNSFDGHWNFPNGAFVSLFGCEDELKARRGRGPPARKAYLDEGAFIPIAANVTENILRPQTMHLSPDELRCSIVVGSSPADEPDAQFTAMAELAEARGAYARRTIHDNPLLTREQVANFIAKGAESRGLSVEDYMRTPEFRREYLAQRVIDPQLVVLPEWEAARGRQIAAIERPEFFDGQVTLDFGGVDPHAAHFGYWHFPLGAYIIEDEVLLRDGENTEALVRALKAKETELWGTDRWEGTLRAIEEKAENVMVPEWVQEQLDKEAPKQPRVRWADNDIQLCRDMHELHGYSVVPTAKDNLELQVNRLRLLVGEGKVYVHPRCIHTDRHWKSTTWANHKRSDFARKANEHGDLLATGVYGVRNLDRQRNPFPSGWGQLQHRQRPQQTLAQRVAAGLRR